MITAADVEREVRRIAEERPDVVYPLEYCAYFNSIDQPDCLFGHAFAALGLNATHFAACNGSGIGDAWEWISGRADTSLQPWMEISLPQKTWFERVQSSQDHHHPWGECITWADQKADEDLHGE